MYTIGDPSTTMVLGTSSFRRQGRRKIAIKRINQSNKVGYIGNDKCIVAVYRIQEYVSVWCIYWEVLEAI